MVIGLVNLRPNPDILCRKPDPPIVELGWRPCNPLNLNKAHPVNLLGQEGFVSGTSSWAVYIRLEPLGKFSVCGPLNTGLLMRGQIQLGRSSDGFHFAH